MSGGSDFCGYVTDATVSGGSTLASLTLSSMVTTSNYNGGMGDILRAADKVKRQYELLHTARLSQADEDDALFLKTEYKVVRILSSDILYVEGMSEYLRIHFSTTAKPVVVLMSMKKMEERLSERDFMRIHKSFIINLHHISEIQRNRVLLEGGQEIPVGDSCRERLNAYISSKFLGK